MVERRKVGGEAEGKMKVCDLYHSFHNVQLLCIKPTNIAYINYWQLHAF